MFLFVVFLMRASTREIDAICSWSIRNANFHTYRELLLSICELPCGMFYFLILSCIILE